MNELRELKEWAIKELDESNKRYAETLDRKYIGKGIVAMDMFTKIVELEQRKEGKQ